MAAERGPAGVSIGVLSRGDQGGGGGTGLPPAREWLAEDYDPRDYPAPPDAYDDEFDDDPGMSGAVNGLAARWAWRNQGSATATFPRAGWLTLSIGAPQGGSHNWRVIELGAMADGTYEALVALGGAFAGCYGGLIAIDDVNQDAYILAVTEETSGAIKVYRMTNLTTQQQELTSNALGQVTGLTGLRVVKAGTALEFWASRGGHSWVRLHGATDAVGVTRIGLAINERGSTGLTVMHVAYFRKVA